MRVSKAAGMNRRDLFEHRQKRPAATYLNTVKSDDPSRLQQQAQWWSLLR